MEETVHFAAATDARLTYALQSASQSAPVRVKYESQNVTVFLSEEQAGMWANETEVGVYTSIDIGEASSLEIIVEKDFACLDRSEEENADTFANPHAGATC